MKTVEVLISTMDRKDMHFVEKMNLSSDAIIINQNKSINKREEIVVNNNKATVIHTIDRGLSKSRNVALENSSADICVIADDDMRYDNDYVSKILKAYDDHPEADIIAFQVKRTGNELRNKNFRNKQSWENFLTSMKISSVEITFKRARVQENNLTFNTHFGAGTELSQGEENLFLSEALKNGLKILYLPINIAEVDASDSSWFEGFNRRHLLTMGAKFYKLSSTLFLLLILQYAIRKRTLYKKEMSFFSMIKVMMEGKKTYQKKYEQ